MFQFFCMICHNLSFTCAVKLYARIMQHPENTERKIQLDSMMSVFVIGHGIDGKYIPIMAHLAKARRWSKR